MIDEGYIKYKCYWDKVATVTDADITELNSWRDRFYQLGLIGEYDNGIGFGNLSIRLPDSQQLIVSGTQTGAIPHLTAQHYTKVTDFDWQKNYVVCKGEIKASSETLTHAAIYVAEPTVNAVVHVHHLQLWRKLLNKVPTTNPNCAYGTPEMAAEIIKICQHSDTQPKIVVMSGHSEGILTYGKDLDEAGELLLKYFTAI